MKLGIGVAPCVGKVRAKFQIDSYCILYVTSLKLNFGGLEGMMTSSLAYARNE